MSTNEYTELKVQLDALGVTVAANTSNMPSTVYKLNKYNIIPTRGCGGGTLSYCHNLHVSDWPQRRRPTGERVCTVCGCMEPRVDYAVQHLSLAQSSAYAA